MDLSRFPMDSISCFLTVESYNYNVRQVRMKWNQPESVIVFKNIELPDFSMVSYKISANQTVNSSVHIQSASAHFTFSTFFFFFFIAERIEEINEKANKEINCRRMQTAARSTISAARAFFIHSTLLCYV